jgi:hypothetical protein
MILRIIHTLSLVTTILVTDLTIDYINLLEFVKQDFEFIRNV